MYERVGMGAITVSDLRRAALRHRGGVGQVIVAAPANGLAPNSPCYDPSHDNGENHCASFTSVIASAFGMGPAQTTTCSQAEESCLQGGAVVNPSITGTLSPAQQSVIGSAAPDICSQTFGISCVTVVLVVLGAMIVIPLLTAGRRL
jgi:hypothetical protein